VGTEGVRAERSASGAGERRDERQEGQYRAGDAMVDLEECVSFGEGRDIQVWSNGTLAAGRKLGAGPRFQRSTRRLHLRPMNFWTGG
jgi:hypothetical protein